MERIIKLPGLFLICVSLFACEKKELPVPAYDRGDVITTQVEMTTNYKNQIWFSLDENRVVSSNFKTAWDLGFEASATGFHVIMNNSKAMRLYKTTHTDLSQVTDTIGLGVHQTCDSPGGSLDSTAVGDWVSNNTVYVVNRGYNELAQHQGYYKFKVISVDAGQYTIEYADIYGPGGTHTGTIMKDGNYNFIAYSFTTHAQANIEPVKTDFDLCFTQYTHIFYDPFQYYSVTGALSNSYNTRVMSISDKPFGDITISDTVGRTFSNRWDKIGYDWKVYDIATNVYTVDLAKCYIINDNKGFFYKLHFIDFYNASGVKGYPKFEYKKI